MGSRDVDATTAARGDVAVTGTWFGRALIVVVFGLVLAFTLQFTWFFVRLLVKGRASTSGTAALVVFIVVSLCGPFAATIRWRSKRAASAGFTDRIARSARAGAGVGAITAVVLVVSFIVMDPIGLGSDPLELGLNGPPGAQSSLENALPDPWGHSGQFLGYDRWTPAALNRVRQGAELRRIHFVDANIPSTSPSIVSVNPVDRFTWAAAALSDQTGRCYVVRATSDRTDPQYGDTRFGELRKGAVCVATSATRRVARSDNWLGTG